MLLPLSENEAKKLAAYITSHPVPTPDKSAARVVTTIEAPIERQLADPRVPEPETILVFKRLGYTSQEVADMFAISLAQTRRLITAGYNRETIADTARDYVAQQFIPKVLANLDDQLNKDVGARLSLEIADKLGLLAGSAASRPPSGEEVTETFEAYRLSILRRRTAQVPTTRIEAPIDAQTHRILPPKDAADDAQHCAPRSNESRVIDGTVVEP